MPISKEALRGYLLEEALAFLIKNTGYNLLVDERQDPQELKNRHHGIVVKGRGAEHQADVLGQLSWIPTFTFPIRLFVEAKFRKGTTSIAPVRNAVGILIDLNQNYHTQNKILVKRYNYNYAIFSTSGFSKDAEDMAFAHKVSLIDLRSPEYDRLLNSLNNASETLVQSFNQSNTNDDSAEVPGNEKIISSIRKLIRKKLRTWPEIFIDEYEKDYTDFDRILYRHSEEMFDTIESYRELLIGMANGPFMIVLKADNVENFLSYSERYPTHPVSIRWDRSINNGRIWSIYPSDDRSRYHLSFVLPEKLGEWIFKNDNPKNIARSIKDEFFSDITIYRSTEFMCQYQTPLCRHQSLC
jgi:hypothetical protein